MKPNRNYKKLESSYLFYDIEQRVKAYSAGHPDEKLLRLGVGDVTLPLCDAVIKAMYSAVEDQSKKRPFTAICRVRLGKAENGYRGLLRAAQGEPR